MSYVVFTIDFEHNPLKMSVFMNYLADMKREGVIKGNVLPMFGKYAGKLENSFIISLDDYRSAVENTRFLDGQESILHAASGNKMECWLEYPADGRTEVLGHMHQVCEEEAKQAEAYTYSPSMNAYWIAKEGNPDNSYRESVAKYRDRYATLRDYLDIILQPLPAWVTTGSHYRLRTLQIKHGPEKINGMLKAYFAEMGENGQRDPFNKHNQAIAAE